MAKLMGKKRGMMQFFDENGHVVPCTVIEVESNVITQIKTKETDGYNAIQIGFETIQTKDPRTLDNRLSKPLQGHYKKANVKPRRHLAELRVDNTDNYSVGQELDLTLFAEQPYVDVMAISKGKGYQGVMKLHNFKGMPATHGAGPVHRHGGSVGMRSTPGRVLPNGKHACHMGDDRKTVQSLKVIKIEGNAILIKGAVPGPRNGLVCITPAIKKISTKAKKA